MNEVSPLIFSADGQVLFSGGIDETVHLWDVQTGEALRVFRSDRLYARLNVTGAVGLTAAQRLTLKALGAMEG